MTGSQLALAWRTGCQSGTPLWARGKPPCNHWAPVIGIAAARLAKRMPALLAPGSMYTRGARVAERFGVRLWTSSGGRFDGRMWQMPMTENSRSVEAIRRKLRALSAVFLDPVATEHEKANAKRLEARLEKQLSQEATPEGAWTDIMFRLGRGVKEMTSPPSPRGDWTAHAFRLGRMIRRGFKR
jgi:hypothetical protein